MGLASASPPRMLGRYALYEQIASGGMATVHIGRLLGPVGFARTVAIKRMRPQFAEDPEFVAMFLDEARVAARIRHPNVVPTLDVVTIEGELFLVMEYVQGESLARLSRIAAARGERIPPSMVAAMMVGVLHGLHAAHEAKNDRGEPLGIVHRDVTPQNILVGVDGVTRVLDFGVAKAAGRSQTTRAGQLKGKIPYMAPEQIQGNATRASDVYAASVVLWEALAGRRLFKGDSEPEVFAAVLAGAKGPPSQFSPGLPPELDAVTMRGLRMKPAERFATAREMARALENAAPLVAASVIGEWVETVAKEALEERSARIAAIETDSAAGTEVITAPPVEPELAGDAAGPPLVTPGPPTPPLSVLTVPVPDPAKLEMPVAIADDAALPTQMSSGSVSAPGRVSLLGTSQRPRWGAAAAGALLGLLAVVGVVLWLQRATPPANVTAAVESSAVPTASAAPALPPTSSVAAAAALAPPSAVPPAALPSAVPPSRPLPGDSEPAPPAARAPLRAPPTSTPPAPRATASTASSAAPSCHPPYYFDGRGVRVFKPECL